MMSDTDNIKDICQEALDNTEITNETLCDDTHDYYLLGKVDLAKEILKEFIEENKSLIHNRRREDYSFESELEQQQKDNK